MCCVTVGASPDAIIAAEGFSGRKGMDSGKAKATRNDISFSGRGGGAGVFTGGTDCLLFGVTAGFAAGVPGAFPLGSGAFPLGSGAFPLGPGEPTLCFFEADSPTSPAFGATGCLGCAAGCVGCGTSDCVGFSTGSVVRVAS